MATRFVGTPLNAEFPASAFPQILPINNRPVLAYDAAADENAHWFFIAPQGLTGTLHAIISYIMASATSGNVRIQAALEAITPGDASPDLDAADSFDTDNSNGGAVPATAGLMQSIDVTLTNADSIAAGDAVRLRIRRDADGTSGTDDATGDMYLLGVEFRDAA